jgi:hypothetical protein
VSLDDHSSAIANATWLFHYSFGLSQGMHIGRWLLLALGVKDQTAVAHGQHKKASGACSSTSGMVTTFLNFMRASTSTHVRSADALCQVRPAGRITRTEPTPGR